MSESDCFHALRSGGRPTATAALAAPRKSRAKQTLDL
jgi:hypothetical protein